MENKALQNLLLDEISFNEIPKALAILISKVQKIETLIEEKSSTSKEQDQWFDLKELCEYLPDKPAHQTVYGWIGQRLIPYHKKGKKLQFLKSEIDTWLKADKRKTVAELQEEAKVFVTNKGRRSK